MTGFLRLPMPSMRTSTRSPGCERADAHGRAGGDDVARQERHDRGDAGDQVLDREDEALGVAGLAPLAVDPGLDLDGVGIDVGGDAGPDGTEGVEGLGPGRLAVAPLDVAGGDVVEAGVAEDVLARPLGGRRGGSACGSRWRARPRSPRGVDWGGIDDGIVGPAERRERLEEDQRLVGHRPARISSACSR